LLDWLKNLSKSWHDQLLKQFNLICLVLKERILLASIDNKVFYSVQTIAFNGSVESYLLFDRSLNEVLDHYYFPKKYVESPFYLD